MDENTVYNTATADSDPLTTDGLYLLLNQCHYIGFWLTSESIPFLASSALNTMFDQPTSTVSKDSILCLYSRSPLPRRFHSPYSVLNSFTTGLDPYLQYIINSSYKNPGALWDDAP